MDDLAKRLVKKDQIRIDLLLAIYRKVDGDTSKKFDYAQFITELALPLTTTMEASHYLQQEEFVYFTKVYVGCNAHGVPIFSGQVRLTQRGRRKTEKFIRGKQIMTKRKQVLDLLYEMTNGSTRNRSVMKSDIVEASELPEEEVWSALDYFENKGLIDSEGVDANGDGLVFLTSVGIDSCEGLQNDLKMTAISHTHNYNAPIGAVQHGPQSSANIEQNFGVDSIRLIQALQHARTQFEELPDPDRQHAIELTDVVEAELIEDKWTAAGKACARELITFLTAVNAGMAIELIKSRLNMS